MEEKYIKLKDGKNMFYRVWRAENTVATLHLNHGMAEHSARYSNFASALNREGFTLYCQDHRGHGNTDTERDNKGWFNNSDGWKTICDDSFLLDELIEKEYPNVPHMIMGHSMGSFLTRTNIALHSSKYRAAVIMGTGYSKGLVSKVGKSIALSRVKKYGSKHKDEFLNNLAFGSYLSGFDYKKEGIFCWLTSLEEEREKYEKDENCGFVCSSSFYADLIDGLETANNAELIKNIRKDLPIFFVSGDKDPVGGKGKGVIKASSLYKKAGIEDVRVKLYKEGRHEILNDKMRDEVISDVILFLKEFL